MPARYSGAGTNLTTRLKRGDVGLSYVDRTANAHDIRYGLALNDDDIRAADNRMVTSLNKASNEKLDNTFNIAQASLIKAKILMEDHLGFKKEWFTTYGRQHLTPEEISLYEEKLKALEVQGFGRKRHSAKRRPIHRGCAEVGQGLQGNGFFDGGPIMMAYRAEKALGNVLTFGLLGD